MAYGNQSCFERCLDKFDSAVAVLLQKTTAEILVICMIWMINFRSLYRGLVIRARTPFMLHFIQVFINLNTMRWTKGFVGTCFKEITTTTALVTNIWWKTTQNSHTNISDILDHCKTFPCVGILYYSTCANHILQCSKSCGNSIYFRKLCYLFVCTNLSICTIWFLKKTTTMLLCLIYYRLFTTCMWDVCFNMMETLWTTQVFDVHARQHHLCMMIRKLFPWQCFY